MPDFETFQLQQKLLSLPEFEPIKRFQSFELSLGIFDHNQVELRTFINRITDVEVGMRLGQRENRILMDSALRELGRLLHNFVAGSLSLVDHTRRLYDKHYGPQRFPEYPAATKKRFAEDRLIQFVHNLRNYVLHYGVPQLSFTTTMHRNEIFTHRIILSRDGLLTSTFEWTALARRYLEELTVKEIDVLQLIDEYRSKVTDFNTWMGEKLASIHASDFQVVSELQGEIFRRIAPTFPARIAEKLAFAEKGLGSVFDVLSSFMTSTQQAVLMPLHDSPEAWTKAAITEIKKHAQLPLDLEQRIYDYAARRIRSI